MPWFISLAERPALALLETQALGSCQAQNGPSVLHLRKGLQCKSNRAQERGECKEPPCAPFPASAFGVAVSVLRVLSYQCLPCSFSSVFLLLLLTFSSSLPHSSAGCVTSGESPNFSVPRSPRCQMRTVLNEPTCAASGRDLGLCPGSGLHRPGRKQLWVLA